MTAYRHTQVGYVMIAAAGVVLVASWYAWGAAAGGPVLIPFAVGLVLLSFSTLTVEVTAGAVEVFFGPGLVRRRIPVHDIAEVRVVRNPWFCGWGIRWIGRGWLWNVSGLRAVELELRNGRRFRVGSDQPDSLANALRQR